MIQIKIGAECLDLPADFSLDIEESSPIFNDAGSQSIEVTLPSTAHNRKLFGFPARTDAIDPDKMRGVRCRVISGVYFRTGTINVGSASKDSISINIGFDNSIAYDAWKSKKLSELKSLPCYKIKSMQKVGFYFDLLYSEGRPMEDDLAVFPICIARPTVEKDGKETEYPEIINEGGNDVFFVGEEGSRTITRVIDNEPTEVTVPAGYGSSPFVKVWKILECVFADLGLTMDCNPFKEDVQLARLVVLNNTADAVCYSTLDYAELMPDCTVEEFLQALFVRFGMVYLADVDAGMVHIKLLRDIVKLKASIKLDEYLSTPPDFEYSTPQYVRLSAGTSLEGAAPLAARLEDFLRGFGIQNVYIRPGLPNWTPSDDIKTPQPGGPIKPNEDEPMIEKAPAITPPITPEKPDGPHNNIEQYCDPIERSEKPDKDGYGFIWDPASGKWSRLSSYNEKKIMVEESTSFFTWDPAPEGYEPLDISSADEFCPVGKVGNSLELMPLFLTGARHFHTYLESDSDEDSGDCPLSFMFAMTGMTDTSRRKTVGRLSADVDPKKDEYVFADGTTHRISLYFHFRNGLYATFWRDYDMMLRNADRKATASGFIGKAVLNSLDILKPMKLSEVPMLMDTADIAIDDSMDAKFSMKMMPMLRHPKADVEPFKSEVPDFPPSPGVL